MKIAIVNHYAVSPTQTGGTRHFYLAHELQRLGHTVTIIAGDFNHFTRCHERNPTTAVISKERCDDVPFVWLKTPRYGAGLLSRGINMLVFAARVFRYGNRSLDFKPDIVIGSSPDLISAYGAYRMAKQCHARFILECRDLWPETFVQLGRVSRYHPLVLLLKRIETHLYRRAELICSLLPFAEGYITRAGVEHKKIIYTPNFINPTTQTRLPCQRNTSTFTFIYVGSLGHANNMRLFVETVTALQQLAPRAKVRFRLLGDGPEKHALKTLCQQRKLTNVTFCGAVSKQEVIKQVAMADAGMIFTHPTALYQFGFSFNKLFDYCQAGLPILMVGEHAFNPVADYRLGLVNTTYQPKAIARDMLALADGWREQAGDFGARTRAFIDSGYTVQCVTQRLCEHLGALSA